MPVWVAVAKRLVLLKGDLDRADDDAPRCRNAGHVEEDRGPAAKLDEIKVSRPKDGGGTLSFVDKRHWPQ